MTEMCKKHNQKKTHYLCHHLDAKGQKKLLGLVEGSIDGETEYVSAWCESCDVMYQKAGEWSELLLQKAQFKNVCEACYTECFWYQMDGAPQRVFNDYQPEQTDVKGLFLVADKFISLANDEDKDIRHVSESFSYAASRYAAFEAVECARDIEKDKKIIIESMTDRFKEMLVENLNDYIETSKESIENKK